MLRRKNPEQGRGAEERGRGWQAMVGPHPSGLDSWARNPGGCQCTKETWAGGPAMCWGTMLGIGDKAMSNVVRIPV